MVLVIYTGMGTADLLFFLGPWPQLASIPATEQVVVHTQLTKPFSTKPLYLQASFSNITTQEPHQWDWCPQVLCNKQHAVKICKNCVHDLRTKDIHHQQTLSRNIWYSCNNLPRKIYFFCEAQDCNCWNSVSWAFRVYSTSTNSKFTLLEKLKINPNINDVADWHSQMLKSNAHQCWPRTTNATRERIVISQPLPYITEGRFTGHKLQTKPSSHNCNYGYNSFFSYCIPHNRQKWKTSAIPAKIILHTPTQESSSSCGYRSNEVMYRTILETTGDPQELVHAVGIDTGQQQFPF